MRWAAAGHAGSDEMLDTLGLQTNKHRSRRALGRREQRVAIGRSLVKNPAFIFADEPTSALDWKTGRR